MSLPSPNLDDRDFQQLLEEARRRIVQSCPGWTDLSPSDPGMVLLELFAHLTEMMIYRLNRLPEKAYVEFLRLMGVKMSPPEAASVTLRFSLSRSQERSVELSRGTRVTVNRSAGETEPPVFVTTHTVTIEPGMTEVDVPALHCDLVEAELVGKGTGLPGLSVTARRPPIVAPTRDTLDLIVTVENIHDELGERAPAVQYDGKAYRIWREVENFTNLGADLFVYIADRMTGTITFAPAVQMKQENDQLAEIPRALASVPPAGREIRLWYRRGGGIEGNVAANTLTTLKDPIPGIQVTNPTPATGGRAAETLQNAMLRGPQELYSLRRAVTARDFELAALRSSGAIVRAKAFTKATLWVHASPGTVEVLLVPYRPEDMRGGGQITAARLKEQETEEARAGIQQALDERRPLGTTCLVNWVRYKTVWVKARVVVHRSEDPNAVKARVVERLHQTINPLPTLLHPSGWPFGQPLRASHVYDIVLKEPGVSYADQVRFLTDEVPEKQVRSLSVDVFQPHTWYATTGQLLFRSMNDGDGWESAGRFPGEEVERVAGHPGKAGLLAVITQLPEEHGGSRLHISWDCGETWRAAAQTAFTVRDIAWMIRDDVPVLLLATDVGLYELAMQPDAVPVQRMVDETNQDLGFYAIAVATDVRGAVNIAVAARGAGGVFLSHQSSDAGTFTPIGLKGEDVRVLAVQYDGPLSFLWAGVAAFGDAPGKGCFRLHLRERTRPEDAAGDWQSFQRNWQGSSCRALAFQGLKVMAATFSAGVVWLDSNARDAAWQASAVGCGLPIRDVGRLYPVDTVAVNPANRLLLAGGPEGAYRSRDEGVTYEYCSSKEFTEKVTLPETWLFCSGEHDIEVVNENEADRN